MVVTKLNGKKVNVYQIQIYELWRITPWREHLARATINKVKGNILIARI